jgi:hypothetical protein
MQTPPPGAAWACPKCHRSIPENSRFCPYCGQAFGNVVPTPPLPAGSSKKSPWPIVIGVLALIGLALGGLAAGGFLRLTQKPPPAALKQMAEPPLPTLKSTVEPPKPEERIEMPADVYAWLEHLRKTEEQRSALSLQNMGQARALLVRLSVAGPKDALKSILGQESGDAPPEGERPPEQEEFQDVVTPMTAQWEQLYAFYRSVPPPAECEPIAVQYDTALTNTGTRIVELLGIIQNAPTDPNQITNLVGELEKSRGQSAETIGKPSQETDRLVGEICAKYKTKKWFSIAGDFGGGNNILGAGAGFGF